MVGMRSEFLERRKEMAKQMQTIEDVFMSVGIEAQERELQQSLEGTRARYEERLRVLEVIAEEFARECEAAEAALKAKLDKIKAAKKAMGFGVRSVSGLLD